MTRFAFGAATHEGRMRPTNQDSVHAGDALFVVADGMGGHRAGEIASRLTVDDMTTRTYTSLEELTDGVRKANDVVVARSRGEAALQGMGTTVCAIALVAGQPPLALLVNVGDSRAYRYRDGELEQLTVDHSYVADLVRRGALTTDQAEIHPYRNMLTRAIGIAEEVEVDAWEIEVGPADRYLLCTDGLFNELTDEAITTVLTENPDPGESARELINQANAHGGRDNVTVIVIDVRDDDAEAASLPVDGEATEPAQPEPEPATEAVDVEAIMAAQDQADLVAADSLDLDPDGASTETRPMGVVTAELPVVEAEPELFHYEAPADERPEPRGRRIPTLMAVGISALIIALLIVAFTAVGLWARSGTHLGFVGDELVVLEGRPGGVLWFDETVTARTGVRRSDLSEEQAAALDGRSVDDAAEGVALAEDALNEATAAAAAESEQPETTGPDDVDGGEPDDVTPATPVPSEE